MPVPRVGHSCGTAILAVRNQPKLFVLEALTLPAGHSSLSRTGKMPVPRVGHSCGTAILAVRNQPKLFVLEALALPAGH
jgi:hypothetical protein